MIKKSLFVIFILALMACTQEDLTLPDGYIVKKSWIDSTGYLVSVDGVYWSFPYPDSISAVKSARRMWSKTTDIGEIIYIENASIDTMFCREIWDEEVIEKYCAGDLDAVWSTFYSGTIYVKTEADTLAKIEIDWSDWFRKDYQPEVGDLLYRERDSYYIRNRSLSRKGDAK